MTIQRGLRGEGEGTSVLMGCKENAVRGRRRGLRGSSGPECEMRRRPEDAEADLIDARLPAVSQGNRRKTLWP